VRVSRTAVFAPHLCRQTAHQSLPPQGMHKRVLMSTKLVEFLGNEPHWVVCGVGMVTSCGGGVNFKRAHNWTTTTNTQLPIHRSTMLRITQLIVCLASIVIDAAYNNNS
jgi:hypothetical protein